MKKKSLLAGLMLAAALGLTACGNPLKVLPEVSDDNFVEAYDDDKETYGNAAVDRLIKQLKKDDIIKGDLTSLVVYDRDDNEETKEKTELSVEVQCETDAASYTEYYVVTMKYDSENKEWKVKETEVDEKEDPEVVVNYEISDESASTIIKDYIYSFYADDYYINFNEGDIIEISIEDPETEILDSQISVTYPVNMQVNYNSYIYDISTDLKCALYTNLDTYKSGYEIETFKNDAIYYINYDEVKVNSVELDPEVSKILGEDVMFETAFEDFDAFYSYYYDFDVTSKSVNSYESSDLEIYSTSAQRHYLLDIKVTEGLFEQYYMDVTYYYDNTNGWYYSYLNDGHNYDDSYNYVVSIDNSFKGSYTGSVNVRNTDCGDITFNVNGIDGNTITGTVEFDKSTVDFTATYDAFYHYFDFRFDEKIKFKKNYSYDYLSLYYDQETDTWRSSDYSSLQVQIGK